MKTIARNAKKSTTATIKPETPYQRAYARADARMRRLFDLAFNEGVVVGVDVERGLMDGAAFPGLWVRKWVRA